MMSHMAKSGKRKDSKENPRVSSGFVKTEISVQPNTVIAGSFVGSVASVDTKSKPRNFPLWPEFTENDINAEKWEGVAKGKDKGKSPSLQFFDDPEGKLEMPPSLKVDHWKRPLDIVTSKIPVVVDNENVLDIVRPNEHLLHSQLIRTILSQMLSLWEITRTKTKFDNAENPWLPWDHIYSLCKAGKGHIPLYNQFGKYIVRLYWMGSWRKIVVDDLIPCDIDDKILLPTSSTDHELWPLLLTKALMKISCLDYNTATENPEIRDYFVIQCLTGWIPETIPLQFSHNNNIWELMKKILPEWKLPEDRPLAVEHENKTRDMSVSSAKPTETAKHEHVGSPTSKPEKSGGKDGKAGKESSRKKDDKEKSKSRPHSDVRPTSARSGTDKSVVEEPVPVRPENVQMAVFGLFSQQHDIPAPMSVLREMANSSEKLRKVGLSHLHTHPVLISKTRSCSLIPPTPVPEIPRWKLIRPHKKKVTPFDEPQPEPEPPKPDQWLELESPFLGYRPTPVVPESTYSVPQSRAGSVSFSEVDEERDTSGETKSKPQSKTSKRFSDPAHSRKTSGLSVPSPTNLIKGDTDSGSEAETVSKHDMGEEEDLENTGGTDAIPSVDEVIRKTWIDFDDFCKSFTNIVIFHKVHTYPYNESAGEMKQAALNAGQTPGSGSKKGSASMNQTTSATNVVKPSTSPVTPKSYEGYPAEERTPSFLFVDSLKQIELIVCFSVLPRWLGLEEKQRNVSDKESVAGASEVVSMKHDAPAGSSIPSGLLVAEPYSWKSLVTGQPILRIRTTGTRAACLTLPPGRHVLRFIFNSPLGYHVNVCSTTKFVFGDEDTVMAPLQEESCRFIEAANKIMSSVEKCLDAFGNEAECKIAAAELRKSHMPYPAENKTQETKHYEEPKELTYGRCQVQLNTPPSESHWKAWRKAFYGTMNAALGETKVYGLEFALRSFLLDFDRRPVLQHPPLSGSKESPDNWHERIPTEEEGNAVVKIQKSWRGTYTRKLLRANKVLDSTEHNTAQEVLKALRTALQHNPQGYALSLLRSMLKINPSLMTKFSFYKDEWNRISYTDYNGTFMEQPPRTWFVVFREIFYVEEDTLCVPKIYVPIVTCMLRVINNDNGEEVKRVFQKVAPHVYKKNKRGYTFVAEARTLDHSLPAGKWRMRLIGSMNTLPHPANIQLTSAFSTKEIKDYYVPNKLHVLMRYTLKTQTSLVASLQLETSKPDVHIHFQIFDNEEEVASTRGKGFCVIPAYYFLTNNRERASSRSSNTDSKPGAALLVQPSKAVAGSTGKKQSTSAKKHDGKASPKERKPDNSEIITVAAIEEVIDNSFPHNYVIQATVEQKSWPLTRSQWSYIQKLKEVEKEELKAFSVNKERLGSAGTHRQSGMGKSGAGDKAKKQGKAANEKGTKEKKQIDKETGSRPSSQNIFDDSRAYWTVRVVTDMELSEEIEVKKDTQRQEEIRAMKQAWETAEPGRAIKAMQSRLAFLNNNILKSESSDKENEEEEKSRELADQSPEPIDDKELLQNSPTLPSPQKDLLQPVDFSPYIRPLKPDQKPRFVNPEVLAILEEESQRVIVEEHNAKRAMSLAYREQNRMDRMALKEHQLEIYQEMQYELDKARTELLKPREEYRQMMLEDQKMKDEAAEAAVAAALAASEPTSPDGKGRKSAGKKKK